MASARAEVIRVTLMQKTGAPVPQPGMLPDAQTRYALVEYRFVDSGVQGAIPFDDWHDAPTIGQIIELTAAVVPTTIPWWDGNSTNDFRNGTIYGAPIQTAAEQYQDLKRQMREIETTPAPPPPPVPSGTIEGQIASTERT